MSIENALQGARMLQKDLNYCELYGLYAAVLTDKQREIADQYFLCDLSLSEIAENANVSRQAAFGAITKVKKRLSELEETLGIFKNRELTAQAAQMLSLPTEENVSAARRLLIKALEE